MGRRGPPKGTVYRSRSKTSPASQVQTTDLAAPDKPKWLSKDASKLWDKLLPRLLQCGHLVALDEFVLAEYCQITAEMEEIHGKLKGKSYIENANNTFSKSSLVSVLNDLRKQQLKLAEQLGLTPKSRKAMSIVVQVTEPNDNSAGKTTPGPQGPPRELEGVVPPRPPA